MFRLAAIGRLGVAKMVIPSEAGDLSRRRSKVPRFARDDTERRWQTPMPSRKEIAMTYTVLGRCHRTGRLGIGIATFSITVGRYCRGVRAMAGVTISQAFANERNNQLALRLLAQGFTAGSVLTQLTSNDPYF